VQLSLHSGIWATGEYLKCLHQFGAPAVVAKTKSLNAEEQARDRLRKGRPTVDAAWLRGWKPPNNDIGDHAADRGCRRRHDCRAERTVAAGRISIWCGGVFQVRTLANVLRPKGAKPAAPISTLALIL